MVLTERFPDIIFTSVFSFMQSRSLAVACGDMLKNALVLVVYLSAIFLLHTFSAAISDQHLKLSPRVTFPMSKHHFVCTGSVLHVSTGKLNEQEYVARDVMLLSHKLGMLQLFINNAMFTQEPT